MKLGFYIKESWHNLRKDKVYSAVYIIGTGVSLALVMAWLTVQSAHFDNSYPEVHRDRTLFIANVRESNSNSNSNSMPGRRFIDRFLLSEPVEGVEALTAVAFEDVVASNGRGEAVNTVAENVLGADFWRIFEFDFLYGNALSAADCDPARPGAVICESLARSLYGRSDIVGEKIFFKGREYRVCGVVRDVPQTATMTFSQLWIPELDAEAREAGIVDWLGRSGSMLGDYFVIMLAEDRGAFNDIRNTIGNRLEQYNNGADTEWKVDLNEGILSVREAAFMWAGLTSSAYTWIGVGIMLFILLIPMINLSGMVSSRMETRMSEFGVRKSFGAWRRDILGQIAGENLLLTLFGGVFGLALSYVLLAVFSEQFNGMLPAETFALSFSMLEGVDAAVFSVRDFFKFRLYVLLLAIVLLLNLLSALLPAMKVMRRSVTESLNAIK